MNHELRRWRENKEKEKTIIHFGEKKRLRSPVKSLGKNPVQLFSIISQTLSRHSRFSSKKQALGFIIFSKLSPLFDFKLHYQHVVLVSIITCKYDYQPNRIFGFLSFAHDRLTNVSGKYPCIGWHIIRAIRGQRDLYEVKQIRAKNVTKTVELNVQKDSVSFIKNRCCCYRYHREGAMFLSEGGGGGGGREEVPFIGNKRFDQNT